MKTKKKTMTFKLKQKHDELMAPFVVACFTYKAKKPIFFGFDHIDEAKDFVQNARTQGAVSAYIFARTGF